MNNICEDYNECLNNPCPLNAKCNNSPGSFTCDCVNGTIFDAKTGSCRQPGDCFSDEDCSEESKCVKNRCIDPCKILSPCGENAYCSVIKHSPMCECAPDSQGDPYKKCTKLECVKDIDCSLEEACVNFKCKNSCSIPRACGRNANCVSRNHVGHCSCAPGYTGDPVLGCVPIQYCQDDTRCSSGTKCVESLCVGVCKNSRECLYDQVCIQGTCRPTCSSNDSCPQFQFCLNRICTKDIQCMSDEDCNEDEKCSVNRNGIPQCIKVCDRHPCGRQAICIGKSHQAVCSCQRGYFGDPLQNCKRKECETDTDCSDDKLCDKNMCKIACLVENNCGDNTICASEKHNHVCYCQPGYTGDPKKGCTKINWCSTNPCGDGAECKNTKDSAQCVCSAGMVGNPYGEGCRKAQECRLNRDCPNVARCTALDGIRKCTDACENVKCGPNAECIASRHIGQCKCKDGFIGNAASDKGCRLREISCTSKTDCPKDHYCHKSICRGKS